MDIKWLESLSQLTDHDGQFEKILSDQSQAIQNAYLINDQAALHMELGGETRLAARKTVFQL